MKIREIREKDKLAWIELVKLADSRDEECNYNIVIPKKCKT